MLLTDSTEDSSVLNKIPDTCWWWCPISTRAKTRVTVGTGHLHSQPLTKNRCHFPNATPVRWIVDLGFLRSRASLMGLSSGTNITKHFCSIIFALPVPFPDITPRTVVTCRWIAMATATLHKTNEHTLSASSRTKSEILLQLYISVSLE